MGHTAKKKEILASSFYQQEDVISIGKKLLGKFLFTQIDGILTGGMVIETESYHGAEDKACHAYNNRRTPRTEVMFAPGGVSYIYLCYGMHHLFNIVTNKENTPHAVLIRAIKPLYGIETMLKRRNKHKLTFTLTNGPGTLTQALGMTRNHNGLSLLGPLIWIEDHQLEIKPHQILASPRIGIAYAEEDAFLPYRFTLINYRQTE